MKNYVYICKTIYCQVARIFLFLILVLLLADCSYQKRIYRKGYYVDWLSKNSSLKKKEKLNTNDAQIPIKTLHPKYSFDDNSLQLLSSSSKSIAYNVSASKKKSFLNDTCGDKMILKSGDEYVVKVLEITDREIKYKRCDNLNGPVYYISKSKVYLIEYANGVKEHIISDTHQDLSEKKKENDLNKNDIKQRIYPPSYYYAWLWLALIFLLGGIVFYFAMYAARKAKREIRENPNKYKGKAEMNFIMYASLIITSLIFLVVLGIIIFMLQMGGGFGAGIEQFLIITLVLSLGIPVIIFLLTSEKEDFE